MRAWKFLLPGIGFVVLVIFLMMGLSRDPREIPSPLIGKPAPGFELPLLLDPQNTLRFEQYRGQVWILNVWASWCVPCLVEHPVLLTLARDRVAPIVGLNYKDAPEDARSWLRKHGDPFASIAADRSGRVALDYGVYGVPETFLIDAQGVIRFKHVGPLTPEIVSKRLLPLIRELRPS